MDNHQKLDKLLKEKVQQVIRPAKGFIKHDYLVPGGPYEEQWDWDGFFIGMSLIFENKKNAVYLKNWCLNYLENTEDSGFTPGLITSQGVDKRLKHVKPFLAQGALFSSRNLGDFSWIEPYWKNLKNAVHYSRVNYYDKEVNLSCWHDSMESGADNNVTLLDYKNGSVAAVDLNSFIYREYLALSKIAENLDKKEEAAELDKKATEIKKAILDNLWDDNDSSFYNLDLGSGELIKRMTYSNFIALWANVAPKDHGQKMISKYLTNSDHMWAAHGVRTLSAKDSSHNQANIIKPHSNWQGPVWPLFNCMTIHILINYEFFSEAKELSDKTIEICLNDLEKTGGMHENYNAETGEPLAAPGFISWNLLILGIVEQVNKKIDPFKI